jgi:hypothetical protein
MIWKLFLDDLRSIGQVYPGQTSQWIVCRSISDAIKEISNRGFPTVVSFDHDLGDDVPTGLALAKYLVDRDLDYDDMPQDFKYAVHSANPPGAANIHSLMDSYLKFKRNK